MRNKLGRAFTFRSLIGFAMPNIIMMVFMSLYTIVDGMFVSRFVGTDALSAINIVYPVASIGLGVGIMLATGASAIIATKMGQGKDLSAKQDFTFVTLVGFAFGVFMMLVSIVFIKPILVGLGANEQLYQLCYDYFFTLACFSPAYMIQAMYSYFFVTAGKPGLGLLVIVGGGVTNIALDYLFIVPMQMGIRGAAIATGIGFTIPAVFSIIYFSVCRGGSLYYVKPRVDWRMLLRCCTNGSSEMVTNLATAVTTYLFNVSMMRYLGPDGVAAITVVLYAQFVFTAIYLGYAGAVAPVISFNYGSGNGEQLKKVYRISMTFLLTCSVLSFVLAIVCADSISLAFAARGSRVFEITVNGFYWFSIGFLFMGVNIFASSLFTALSDGRVSAMLSFLRTFLFIVVSILVLPQLLGANGIWLAIPVAEALGLVFSLVWMARKRKVYGYA